MAPAFKLYGNRGSANSERVRLMLLDAGFTDYEYVVLNPDVSLKGPDHLLLHPFGKIPALVMSDGFTLFESRAICTFLARTLNLPLLPTASDTEGTALFEQAASVETCYFAEHTSVLALELFAKPVLGLGETDDCAVERARKALEVWAEGVDRILEKQEEGFMAGKEFSLVDVFYLPMVKRMEDCGATDVLLGRDRIREWWERCLERPAVKEWEETAVNRQAVIAYLEKLKAEGNVVAYTLPDV
ncbi:glutathione S-transferase [Cadophora sp. DSE1049]|nr:glutathione S-transferase [Cadophora sp. DSE1049]